MEMNRMSPQEEPARESGIEENPADHSAATEIAPEPLYDPAEAETIVRLLTKEGLFDPEYILLFGSLAGGTPHSEAC